MLAAERVADDVVHLLLAAGAQAPRALDTGVQVHRDRRVRQVGLRLLPRLEARLADFQGFRPMIELGVERVGFLRNVREQELEHHLLAGDRARVVGRHLHPVLGVAAAGRREHALALDLDHAGAAVAVGPHAFLVAEVRDLDAVMPGRLDEGLVGPADDGLAVQLELNRHRRRLRGAYAVHTLPPPITRPRWGSISSQKAPGWGRPAPARIWMRPSSPGKVPSAAADPIWIFLSASAFSPRPRGRACTVRRTPRRRTWSGCARRRSPGPCPRES